MNDLQVIAKFAALTNAAFPYSDVCQRCGDTWNYHVGVFCADKPAGSIGRKATNVIYSPPGSPTVPSQTYNDIDVIPEERIAVNCLNCGYEYVTHSGWQCGILPRILDPIGTPERRKSKLPANRCYLTPDMKVVSGASITSATTPQVISSTTTPEQSEWKVWRDVNRAPHQCPCGDTYGRCPYHPHP